MSENEWKGEWGLEVRFDNETGNGLQIHTNLNTCDWLNVG